MLHVAGCQFIVGFSRCSRCQEGGISGRGKWGREGEKREEEGNAAEGGRKRTTMDQRVSKGMSSLATKSESDVDLFVLVWDIWIWPSLQSWGAF